MRNLRRNKRKLYLCQKHIDGSLYKFQEPIKLYENYQPTNSEGDLISIGTSYPSYLRIKTTVENAKMYHPKDRVYVYTSIPKKPDTQCKTADYEVYKEPLLFINEGEVMLKRLSSELSETDD